MKLNGKFIVKEVTPRLKEVFPKIMVGHVVEVEFIVSKQGSFVYVSTSTYKGRLEISLHTLYTNFVVFECLEEF